MRLLLAAPVLALLSGAARADDDIPTACLHYADGPTTVSVPAIPSVESSGLAASHTDDGVYFTHDDSGHDAALYLFRLDGIFLKTQVIRGATNTDWEDIASAPCPDVVDAADCLYIADIGDNGEDRDHVTVWVVPDTTEGEVDAIACDLVYPDGAAHDAEAITVSPDGTVRIIRKESTPPTHVYKVNQLACDGGTQTLQEEAELDIDGPVTGGAMNADGTALILRSHDTAWIWSGCSPSFDDDPEITPLPGEPFGEAVAVSNEGELVTTQEQAEFLVHVWPCDTAQEMKCTGCGCGVSPGPGAWVGWAAGLVTLGLVSLAGRGTRPSRSPA